MEGEEGGTDWYSKYKNIKNKLRELKSIRIESVKTDKDDLKQKIDEHKKVHEISIKELKQQNSDLRESIKDIEDAKKDIKKIQESINSICKKLKKYDVITNAFIGLKNYYIECIGYHKYQITHDINSQNQKDSLVFQLCLKDNGIEYIPVHCPDIAKRKHPTLFQSFIFTNDISDFVNAINALKE